MRMGQFPADLNRARKSVCLSTEMNRTGFVAWYRNPSRAGSYSLGIAYGEGDGHAHGAAGLSDLRQAGGRLHCGGHRGPARHAVQRCAWRSCAGLRPTRTQYAGKVRRVDAIAAVGDTLKVLDLTDAGVREAVAAAADAQQPV
jgi:type III restriction enzyme